MKRCVAPFLALALVALAGCSSSQRSPEVSARYEDPEVGAARLMADATARVREVVDVTSDYPDPDHRVVGAAVLVDGRMAGDAPPTDFRHRPVFVVYVDKGAARHAVAGRAVDSYLQNGSRVIYLPRGFPERARDAYERGLGAALQ